MYLSRLVLNPRSRRARSESADPYQMHRSIMRAFPEDLPPGERILYRLDVNPRTGVLTVLVQSQGQPDWSWMGAERGYLLPLDEPNPWVKTFQARFTPGQRLAFRLRANPTVKRQGRRHGLFREEDQLAWLHRKAQDGGFAVLEARTQEQGNVEGWTSARHRLRMWAVQYEGLLQVTEPSLFLETLRQGIGPGKGLGFGLLSVAPPL